MPFTFPTNRELTRIAPAKQARLSATRVGLQIMPIRGVNAAFVQWDQRDNYFGLQQLRGLDGRPPKVKPIGSKRYSYEPGVYGEYETITETELTIRAPFDNPDMVISVDDMVLDRQDQLLQRELDRIEYCVWTLLTTGTISVPLAGGVIGFQATFAIQTYTASVAWATFATAKPIADFRAMKLLGRGLGVSFGPGATAYMNAGTASNMLANTNAADLSGRRVDGGNTLDTTEGVNRFLRSNGAPGIVEYDEGYYDDSNAFQLWIPNNKVVVIGQRAQGQKVGEYVKTYNAVAKGPTSYTKVIDRTRGVNGEVAIPPNMEIHQGHSGGPIIWFPGSVIVATV